MSKATPQELEWFQEQVRDSSNAVSSLIRLKSRIIKKHNGHEVPLKHSVRVGDGLFLFGFDYPNVDLMESGKHVAWRFDDERLNLEHLLKFVNFYFNHLLELNEL
jgi:hypothetical protein